MLDTCKGELKEMKKVRKFGCTLVRSFLPVGQGGFYVEQFQEGNNDYPGKTVNIVYDCGSLTGEKYVENQIHDTFMPNEIIDAVFISHLDADHINGLHELLSYCHVLVVYLPYLTETEKQITLIHACFSAYENKSALSSFQAQLITAPVSAIRDAGSNDDEMQTSVAFVTPLEYDKTEYDFELLTIASGVQITSGNFTDLEKQTLARWRFVPWNFENIRHTNCFISELIAEGLIQTISDLPQFIEEVCQPTFWGKSVHAKKLKGIYRKLPGNINTNSMALYSGPTPLAPFMRQDVLLNGTIKHLIGDCNDGCLYLGDFDASQNFDALFSAYSDYVPNIGIMQIPHHGSLDSYNRKISSLLFFFIISAGSKNPYRHPSTLVTVDLIKNRARFAVVTEDIGSRIQCCVKNV